jgi:hypothetical protein
LNLSGERGQAGSDRVVKQPRPCQMRRQRSGASGNISVYS